MKTIAEKTEKTFKEAEKMQLILSYIMENLKEEIKLEDLRKILKCSDNTLLRRFKKYYGVPCERFITMLKMRAAAQELLSGTSISPKILSEQYRFSDVCAFSKAFKREIGFSPRIFMKLGKNVPDMPMPKEFYGHKMHFKYMKIEQFEVYGYKKPLINGTNTNLLKECGYPLEYGNEFLNPNGNKDQIGFWWSDVKDKLFYVLGYKMYSTYDVPKDADVFHFDGSDYAVFSVERGDNLGETLLAHRMMVYYVMMVWQRINNKIGNKMTYTYEVFGRNYTYLYLPLWKGMPQEEAENASYSTGLDDWIKYIDRHIKEEL